MPETNLGRLAPRKGSLVIGRSQMTRYDFGAIAEVIDLDSREDVIVVTRDLSLRGCFVKTRTPFAPGTAVRVRITYAGADFAAIGSVTGNITWEGMEIEFVQIEPKHQATIEEWLAVTAFKSVDGCHAAGASTTQFIRLKNRLSRREQKRRAASANRGAKADGPQLVAKKLSDSAEDVWKARNDPRY